MRKGNNLISCLIALVAVLGAVAAVCAYLKSKKTAQQIREDFLDALGYEFDDSGSYCGCGECAPMEEEKDPASAEE